MTSNEFSNEFDVLYNNITSLQAPGLDEYEKSVFLTKAQDEIIKAYFDPRGNKVLEGFDGSKRRQIDFSALMKTKTLSKSEVNIKFDDRSISYRIPADLLTFVNESCKDNKYRYVVIPISYEEYDRLMLKPYLYPVKRGIWRLIVDSEVPVIARTNLNNDEGFLQIANSSSKEVTFSINIVNQDFETIREDGIFKSKESIGEAPIIIENDSNVIITCNLSSNIESTKDYWSTFLLSGSKSKPWLDKLKLYVGDLLGTGNSSFPNVTPDKIGLNLTVIADPITPSIELIGRVDEESLIYSIRYIRRPRPIIIRDLPEDLSIHGISKESTCELDESIHPEILLRAVELAKAAYTGDLQSQLVLGLASLTEIGMVTQQSR